MRKRDGNSRDYAVILVREEPGRVCFYVSEYTSGVCIKCSRDVESRRAKELTVDTKRRRRETTNDDETWI